MDLSNARGPALVQTPRAFFRAGDGRWAGERFMEALARNESFGPQTLRTNALLRRDEWIEFDRAIVEGARTRLQAVADLLAAGLTRTISAGMAKSVYNYQTIGDMDDAIVSMDGVTRSENDRIEFGDGNLPLPFTHKDWYLNLRHLLASRTEGGESLDVTYARVAGRKCGEMSEQMLVNGGPQFGNMPIYGYTTHPDRITASFSGSLAWTVASGKTGAQALADLYAWITLLEANQQFGPYWLYLPAGASTFLGGDFKSETDKTIRQRLMDEERLTKIAIVDKLPAGSAVLVQPNAETIVMVIAEELQNIQWDTHGGFIVNFKSFQIMVPLIRADSEGRLGLVHASV